MLPFENKTLSAAKRADDLLARLNLDEKIGMLNMKNSHQWNGLKTMPYS